MGKTLYVGNLAWTTTSEQLASAFEPHCQVVSARIITENESGRSKGFGFIEIEGEPEKAIKEMNGFSFNGRSLIVSEARQKQNRA
ncbi:MAG: RNP-1 like RNA-binding protein [Candidatus Saganbacteria bacterium]|uniref:RNP-1 like RNA-binding protein n=1 Tax=Candidatus Saganbacteria bacterium TaxID=2575572 RepID=A0A833P3H3_UNCSA|nr:MAG: RNP-1 like RNA-binding protein [Candidatus Saganbacteria bacterium]